MAALRSQGVTDLFVHVDQAGSRTIELLDGMPGVRKIATDGAIVRYHLD
jgi:hypothetical protein